MLLPLSPFLSNVLNKLRGKKGSVIDNFLNDMASQRDNWMINEASRGVGIFEEQRRIEEE